MSLKYNEAKSIGAWWRTYYKIPRTDPRWLNATQEDIDNDYLDVRLREFRDEFDKTHMTEKFTVTEVNKVVEQEVEAIRMNIGNYATPEFMKEVEEEEKALLEAYKLNKDSLSKPEQMRAYQITKRNEMIRAAQKTNRNRNKK